MTTAPNEAARFATSPAARLVDGALSASPLTLAEAGARAGLAGNALSMIRRGSLALPAERAGALAEALGIEPMRLVRACIDSYPSNRSWRVVAMALGLDRAA